MEDPPQYKKFKIDLRLRFICQTKGPRDYTNYIENPSIQAIDKLISTTSERCGYGGLEFEPLNSRLHGSSANELLKTEFRITKTVTKMSPRNMLLTAQGLDLRKGQVQEMLRPYIRRGDDHLPVIPPWLHRGTSENSATTKTYVYSARKIQGVNFMM